MPAPHATPDRAGTRPRRIRGGRAPRLPPLPTGLALLLLAAAPATATDLPPALVADFTRQVQPLLLNKCAAGACHGGPSAPPPRLMRAGVSGQFDRNTTLANMAALDDAIRQSGSHRGFLTTISGRHPAEAGSSRLTLSPLTPAERSVLDRWLSASAERRGPPRLLPAQPEPERLATAAPEAAAATPPAPPDKKPSARGDVEPAAATVPAESPVEPTAPRPKPAAAMKSGASPEASAAARPATAAPRPNRFRALIDRASNPPPLPPPEKPRGVLLGPAEE